MVDQEISRDTIAATYNRLRPHVRRTPVLESSGADFGIDAGQITFKLEHLQYAGSFKSRRVARGVSFALP